MPTWPMVTSDTSTVGITGGTTVGESLVGRIGTGNDMTHVNMLCRDSYTIGNLYVRVTVNSLNNVTSVTDYINELPGAVTVLIGATTTGVFTDAVNTNNLVAGNRVCSVVVATGVGTINIVLISYTLTTASNNTPVLMSSYCTTTSVGFGATRYVFIDGRSSPSATENNAKYTMRQASTLSNLAGYVHSNTLDAATTIRTRVNNANGGQSVTINSGVTGAFEDAVNTDAVASGQTIDYQIVAGGTAGAIIVDTLQVKSSCVGRQMVSTYLDGTTQLPNNTYWYPVEGYLVASAVAESNAQTTARATLTAKNLQINVVSNGLTAAATLRFRKDTGNGNQTISIGAGVTGILEDNVNTDSLVVASVINYQLATVAGGTNIMFSHLGVEVDQPTVAGVGASAKRNFDMAGVQTYGRGQVSLAGGRN